MSEITPDCMIAQGFSPTFVQRFWLRVDKNGPTPIHRPELGCCWVWTRCGVAMANCKLMKWGRKAITTHRASWIIHFGSIPEGILVCHACDNPACVRPDHLFLGNHAANQADKHSKGRHKNFPVTHYVGIENHSSKLTEDQVRAIHRTRKSGLSADAVARSFGVTKALVSLICKGRLWKHLALEPFTLILKPGPKRGEQNGHSKLKSCEVHEVLRLLALGVTHKEIAKRFCVVEGTIGFIARGETWKHLPRQQVVDSPNQI